MKTVELAFNNDPCFPETLYMQPKLATEGVWAQNISIAPIRNREISIIMSKHTEYNGKYEHHFNQMWFTEEEVDLIIKALQKAKKQWDTGEIIT